MSDPRPPDSPDPRLRSLANDFVRLDPADQDLVLALVARLLGEPVDSPNEPPFKPDVPFMDFLE